MGLLAADRKKQRWSGDPRGKSWSENKNKISNKMMEKMGWKDGEGLGADGQGMLNVSTPPSGHFLAGHFSQSESNIKWTIWALVAHKNMINSG